MPLGPLGQPFGSPSRIINIPAPAGSGNAAALQMQAASSFGAGVGSFLQQRKQQELEKADLDAVQQHAQDMAMWQQTQQQVQQGVQGVISAQQAGQDHLPALAGAMQGMMGPIQQQPVFPTLQSRKFGDIQAQLALQQQFAGPIPAAQQIAGKQLDRINLLESKVRNGTATKQEKTELQRSLARNKPLVEFSGLDKILTPEQRKTKATQVLKKPLTTTEVKGVDTIIGAVVGESKPLPFGAKRGAAVKQADTEKMWEQVAEETGYNGRSRIAQKQIESRFDRKIATLNKGKGVGVLANQYQWSRKKWEVKQVAQRRPNESIDDFSKRIGL